MRDSGAESVRGGVRAALADIGLFSRLRQGAHGAAGLRPYQLDAARAIVAAVHAHQGATITVMMARQMGKNELSAWLETYLLTLYAAQPGLPQIIKAAPTLRPQLLTSQRRLHSLLRGHPFTNQRWRGDGQQGIRVGNARVLFLSASPSAHVVGATASLLLEIDEAQDVDPDLYARVFRPMAASTNAPTVLYGTAWTDDTLLAQQRAHNLAREQHARQNGHTLRLHFEFPWSVLAALNPAYGTFVRAEIARLGANHPIIRTQYELCPVPTLGYFLSPDQRAALRGHHTRQIAPTLGECYVAGVDVAGADEEAADAALRALQPRRDSTVITIARVLWTRPDGEPTMQVVDHIWWTGHNQVDQLHQLHALLGERWACRAVAIDATGIGAGLAAFLQRALGIDVVQPMVFSAPSKSKLAFTLLGMVNSGRASVYAADGSPACAEFWRELDLCRYEMRADSTQMRFFVPDSAGHDDFVISLALCAHAAQHVAPPSVGTVVRPPRLVI